MSYKHDIHCIYCDIEFEGELYESGNCPQCGTEYYWDEFCTEDYSDCWMTVEWEKYNK